MSKSLTKSFYTSDQKRTARIACLCPAKRIATCGKAMWTDNNEAVQLIILPPVEYLSVFFGLRMFYEGIKMEINKLISKGN